MTQHVIDNSKLVNINEYRQADDYAICEQRASLFLQSKPPVVRYGGLTPYVSQGCEVKLWPYAVPLSVSVYMNGAQEAVVLRTVYSSIGRSITAF